MGYMVMGAQIGGALMSASAAGTQVRSQQAALNYQADVASMNARLSEMQAQSALQTGQRQAGAVLRKGAAVKAAQKTSTAANGIALDSDTATRNLASTEFMRQSDALTIDQNYTQMAANARMQKTNYENEARFKSVTASTMDAGAAERASLLGSAASIAMNGYMLNKYGAFDSLKADWKTMWA